jgi:hypothetical protein
MAIISFKPFQQQAVDSAVAVFDHMRRFWSDPQNDLVDLYRSEPAFRSFR